MIVAVLSLLWGRGFSPPLFSDSQNLRPSTLYTFDPTQGAAATTATIKRPTRRRTPCQIITIETTAGAEAIEETATIEITTGAAAVAPGPDQDLALDLQAIDIPAAVAFHRQE